MLVPYFVWVLASHTVRTWLQTYVMRYHFEVYIGFSTIAYDFNYFHSVLSIFASFRYSFVNTINRSAHRAWMSGPLIYQKKTISKCFGIVIFTVVWISKSSSMYLFFNFLPCIMRHKCM